MTASRPADTTSAPVAGGDPAQPGGGAPAGPADRADEPLKPGRRGYWIAGALVVLSTVAAIVGLVWGIGRVDVSPGEYERVSVPGSTTLELERTGTYRLHGETTEIIGYGASYVSETIDAPIVVVKGPNGRVIRVREVSVSSSTTYVDGDREGVRFGEFEVATPGRYTVDVRTRTEDDPATRTSAGADPVLATDDVAIEEPVDVPGVVAIVASTAGTGLVWVIAFIIWMVTLIRRSSARRKRNPRPIGPYGPGPYVPGPYGPGAYGPGSYGSAPYRTGPYGAPGPSGAAGPGPGWGPGGGVPQPQGWAPGGPPNGWPTPYAGGPGAPQPGGWGPVVPPGAQPPGWGAPPTAPGPNAQPPGGGGPPAWTPPDAAGGSAAGTGSGPDQAARPWPESPDR